MASPDIYLGEGDRKHITDVLKDAAGNPKDLTGKTVVFRYRVKNQTLPEVDDPVTVAADPTTGGVDWLPSSAAVASPVAPGLPGNYNGNWVINPGLPDQDTVPNDRYLWVQVWPAP